MTSTVSSSLSVLDRIQCSGLAVYPDCYSFCLFDMFLDFGYIFDIQFTAIFCYELNFNTSGQILIIQNKVYHN